MLKISIIKVENPSCLWGRVLQSLGNSTEMTEQYDTLLAQMNLFYHDITRDQCKVKPTSVKEGQVCVVYWSVMKSWCRAVVESIIIDSVSCKARCLLVDHGEQIVVASDQIREAVQNFLQLPFWVRKFHLARIKPTTLQVSVCKEKAKLTPSAQWDSSATLYVHKLLQEHAPRAPYVVPAGDKVPAGNVLVTPDLHFTVSTWTEALLLETESGSTSIELYLTIRDVKVCVNDDLVTKRFAYYTREQPESNVLEQMVPPSIMPSSILTQIFSKPLINLTAETQPTSEVLHGPVISRATDWLTASSPLQSQQQEPTTSEGDSMLNGTKERLSSGSQSQSITHHTAAHSDTSDETDLSLAAALTRNLSLFKFLKFINPGSYRQAAAFVGQHEQLNDTQPTESTVASSTFMEYEICGKSGTAGFDFSQDDFQADDTSNSNRSVDSGSANAEQTRSSEIGWTCSQLLEWLNPEPLNCDLDAGDDAVLSINLMNSGILVHSAIPVEPCNGLDDAPITDVLRLVLRRKQYSTLSLADRYSWPAVSRGCNTIIVSHNADQPLSYLAPLLTNILLNSVFSSFTSSTGPVAVLLCPNWERVQTVYDQLENTNVAKPLHPAIVLLGVRKDEAKNTRIPKNCLFLVTTPFSFVRLLSCHCFMFLRLYHLVLDEADQLFTHASDQMATILQHFQKVTSSEENATCPQQLVAVAKHWNSHMESLLTNHMPYPCIVMSVPEEAALYGNIQQVILITLESSKVLDLLGMLDFSPDLGQKTLIITNSAQEVEDVFLAVRNKSLFCLSAHEGSTDQFDFVIQQWRKSVVPGTNVILVTTKECLKCFGIRDANCVIHYSFPTSPKLFGSRLFCMSENFRNLSGLDQTDSCSPVARSVLLISEKDTHHVIGVLRYLRRTNATLPPELLSFAQSVLVAREDMKTYRPLCGYLKSFGFCSDSSACPDRHRFISQLDQSKLPASGVIEVVPLHIKTASVFYGRIISKEDSGFDELASQMAAYYAEKKPGVQEVLEGGLYALQEDTVFHRVKILSVPNRGDHLFFKVYVLYIDVGKEEEVKSYQILHLPQQFHSLPSQAVEIIVCRVKPIDAEVNWPTKVTRVISQKIQGVKHHATAVLSLGNTVFVDHMVQVTQVPGMKTLINEYAVQSEILNSGMGVSNPEHLNMLRVLCQEGEVSSSKDESYSNGNIDGEENSTTGLAACLSSASGNQSTSQQVNIIATVSSDPTKSFHPQIRWYQTSDAMTVTVKLMNPKSQRCDFYPDRVDYSGRVNGRFYSASLELYGSIDVDHCSWEMKYNEPVLKLVKKQQGNWEKLLKNKNIFVSYDMDHLEEDENRVIKGQLFVENTGEENWYVSSENSSDSD